MRIWMTFSPLDILTWRSFYFLNSSLVVRFRLLYCVFSQVFVNKCYTISAWHGVCQSDQIAGTVSKTNHIRCSVNTCYENCLSFVWQETSRTPLENCPQPAVTQPCKCTYFVVKKLIMQVNIWNIINFNWERKIIDMRDHRS
jgi:hypothetical protein